VPVRHSSSIRHILRHYFWESCSHTSDSIKKQYRLILDKGLWCDAASKVTVGMMGSTGSLLLGLWLLSPVD